jgi:hypothetical protein
MNRLLEPYKSCGTRSRLLGKGLIGPRRVILQMFLVGQPYVALKMGTTDRLSLRVVPQVLPVEVPFKAFTVARRPSRGA